MIGRTNSGGGGGVGGSELMIFGGTTSPAKAAHNTIWIYTDVEITSHVLSATEPENPVEGMAWVPIGDTGNFKATNPIGGDWIAVYLFSAKQFIKGAWADKKTGIYQCGEWVEVGESKLWLIQNGAELVTVQTNTATKKIIDGFVQVTGNGDGLHSAYITADLTDYENLVVEGEMDSFTGQHFLCVWEKTETYPNYSNKKAFIQIESTGATLPIGAYSGEYKVGVNITGSRTHKIANLYLE